MAGHPIKRAMLAALQDRGGLDWVLGRVANGDTMWSIAEDLGCTRNVLADWLNYDTERKALYYSARAASAAAHAERALEIADKTSETGTSKARLQVETRQWLAGVYDREQFAQQQKHGVQINIGTLHLDALRRVAESDINTVEINATPTKQSELA